MCWNYNHRGGGMARLAYVSSQPEYRNYFSSFRSAVIAIVPAHVCARLVSREADRASSLPCVTSRLFSVIAVPCSCRHAGDSGRSASPAANMSRRPATLGAATREQRSWHAQSDLRAGQRVHCPYSSSCPCIFLPTPPPLISPATTAFPPPSTVTCWTRTRWVPPVRRR